MRVLRKGMKGEDVKSWQLFLVGQKQSLEADGDFGNQTHRATVAFQKEHHLEPDGEVGNQTLGKAMMLGFEVALDPENKTEHGPNFPPPPKFKQLIGTTARQKVFGAFDFKHAPVPGNRENIRILGGWEKENIARVPIPQLVGVRGAAHDGGVRFHKLAVAQLVALWQAWEKAKLLNRVLTWDGAFVPRFIRGSTRTLSNHAFGTAFDINAEFNPLGARPALLGMKGCVREMVEIANDHGFFWGGHFADRPDGMHFEIAVIKK